MADVVEENNSNSTEEINYRFSAETFALVDDFLETKWSKNQIMVLAFSLIGIGINMYATVVLHRQKTRRLFAR